MISVFRRKDQICFPVIDRHRRELQRFLVFARAMKSGLFGMATIVVVLGMVADSSATVFTDDFSDGTDGAAATATNPASPPNVSGPIWSHLDGEVESTGQIWDASTGQYRIVAPGNSPNPLIPGYGFAGSYMGPNVDDVRVTADIVEFPNIGAFGSFFGITARLNGDNSFPSVGVGLPLRGYGYQYEPAANGTLGEMVLVLIYGDGLQDIRSQKGASTTVPILDNTKDYRFVLETIGNVLHGQVFEIDGGGAIVGKVAEQFRNLDLEPIGNIDHDGDNNTPEQPFVPYVEGHSGAYAVGYVFASDGDATFDNFRSEDVVAGDYNRNNVVDSGDYVLWRKTLGNAGPTANPPTSFQDMSANGDVTAGELSQVINQGDYTFWRSRFGNVVINSGIGSGSSVPEPAGALLVLLGLASFACRRRNR
jgi:dockerin type I repeat protein